MTQADTPESHRWGSLGDVPDPGVGGLSAPFSVDDSGSLLLNGRRPSLFGFTSGLLEVYFSCLSVCVAVRIVCVNLPPSD